MSNTKHEAAAGRFEHNDNRPQGYTGGVMQPMILKGASSLIQMGQKKAQVMPQRGSVYSTNQKSQSRTNGAR